MTARTTLAWSRHLIEDTRQQFKMPWGPDITVERRTMPEADLTTPILWSVAAIELKRDDFPQAVGSERPRIDRELDRLQPYRWKCIVVAKDLAHIYPKTQVHPHAIIGSVASWYARHDVPCFFVGNDVAAARLCIGILARWEQRVLAAEGSVSA